MMKNSDKFLRGLGKDFYHQTVTTKQIEDYISKNLELIFLKFLTNILEPPKSQLWNIPKKELR
jgi:hypothetical protein